jgi:hypothetical protein
MEAAAAGGRGKADGAADGAAAAAAPDGSFELRCQGADASWTLRVTPDTTAAQLKAQVAAASGTAAAQQRLIYQGAWAEGRRRRARAMRPMR